MLDSKTIVKIYSCTTSDYQTNLLNGIETWSGSSLRGKARKYGCSYYYTRQKLVSKINAVLPSGYKAVLKLRLHGAPKRWKKELAIINNGSTEYWDDILQYDLK